MKRTLTPEPGPMFVRVIDLDSPIPQLAGDERHQSVLVVGKRGGIPCGVVQISLNSEAPAIEEQLKPLLFHQAGATPLAPISDAGLPTITVVVPTIVSRREDLQSLLEGLVKADYPKVEFLLVDNRGALPVDDPLPELVGRRSPIRVIRELRPGISAARNAGIAAATGEVVAFTDDDVMVDPGWLRAIGNRFAHEPELDAVTGLILPTELETPAQIWFERYYGGFSGERSFSRLTLRAAPGPKWLRGSRVIVGDAAGSLVSESPVYGAGAYGAGANMAFRRERLLTLGGFDVALGTGTPARGGEDLAMLIQVLWNGGLIGYEPSAVAHHRHRREEAELLLQLRGYGLGFTAMLTSLILADRRHLLGLGSQLPRRAGQLFRQSLARSHGIKVGTVGPAHEGNVAQYPRHLVIHELSGYPWGPLAYLRSRRQAKSWAPPAGTALPSGVVVYASIPSTIDHNDGVR